MDREGTLTTLPLQAMDSVPRPNATARRIVALVKENGRVYGYKLSDGEILTKEEGVALAKAGGIKGVGIAHRKDTEYLKSLPDETEENNLTNLPSIDRGAVSDSGNLTGLKDVGKMVETWVL